MLTYKHISYKICIRCRLLDHEGSCSTDGTVTQSLGGIIDFKTCVEVFFCVKCENPFPSMDDLQQHKALLRKLKPFDIILSEGRLCCSVVLRLEARDAYPVLQVYSGSISCIR